MNKEKNAIIILFTVAFIWGSAFIAIDDAIASGWQTFPIVAVRGLVGALVLSPFAIKQKFWKNKKNIINGIVLGVLYFCAFYLQTAGQASSNAINAAFLTVLYAVFAPLILRIFFKEKQEKTVYIGALLSILGVFFLTILAYGSFSINIGDILLTGCAIFFALHIIYAKKSTDDTSPIVLVFLQLLTMGLLSTLFMPISGQTTLQLDGLLPVLYCAVFSSALASLGQITAQKDLNSSKASIIMAQEVLIATILASIVAKEIPSIYVFIGGVLMFASVIIIEVKFKAKGKNNE